MMKFAVKSAFLFLISLFVFSLATRNVSAATVVNATNMNGWAFQVQSPNGSGTFATGPATAPLGTGSARLFTGTNGNLSTSIHLGSFNSFVLQDVTNLEYSTYSQSTGASVSKYPLLILNLSTSFGPDELVFDPVNQSQAPQLNVWQNWSTVDGVWKSNAFPQFSGSLSDYIAGISQSPGDITLVNSGTGAIRLQAGPASSTDVFDQNVDNFTINGTTYDFEPMVATNVYSAQNYSDNNFQNPVGDSTTPIGTLLPNQSGYRLMNNWGMGSPAPGVPVNNFSVAWEGTFDFDEREYNFVGSSDNSFKIYVDGELVTSRETAGPAAGSKLMTAGIHTVRVEYIHGTGNSFVNFAFYKQMFYQPGQTPNPTGACFDLTGDGIVNVADLGFLGSKYGTNGLSPYDLTGDGVVNVADLGILASKFGKPCPY